MNVQTEVKTADNGVNVEALLGARAALTDAPAAAQFTWRAECDWMGGVHSRSTVAGFFGLGATFYHGFGPGTFLHSSQQPGAPRFQPDMKAGQPCSPYS